MLAVFNRQFIQPLMAWKNDSPHLKHLKVLQESQYDSPDTIRVRQLRALREIVRHACTTVPYYRQRWHRTGLRLGDLRTLDDLAQFPVLTKDDLRANGDALRSDEYLNRHVYTKTTSGSTGV